MSRRARPHRATLLHYVAANGIETDRQRTPPNAPDVVRLLVSAGAEVDALAAFYGGGPAQTTLCLAVSSGHPNEVGVAGELVHALEPGTIHRGARYHPDRRDAPALCCPSPALPAATGGPREGRRR